MRRLIDAPDSDLYDVLAYVLFSNDPKTRTERAGNVPLDDGELAQGELKELLASILQSYVEGGERELRTEKLNQYIIAKFGSVGEGKQRFGVDLASVRQAYWAMQGKLYQG